MSEVWKGPLIQIDEYRWRIPKEYKPGMRVDGLIFASKELIEQIRQDQAPEQVANVAFLPGIVGYSIAMPDIHWAMASPSEASPRWIWTRASSRLGESGTTSIAFTPTRGF
jgi:tRNA-splicing ligase RtcB (3'-phosphate/5'-hydroxy nucleic acid ligase)